jgi:lipopolysaccharide transport protein LptA|tara:strand:+ start:1156 stop:1572 length:417 start_codon:yes stop_codon:yes gene_type:complete
LKNKYLIIIPFFLFILDLNSKSLASEVKIESDKVEFSNDSKNISFFSNVNINSSYVEISASSAIYDDKKEVISISGDPSSIKSNKENNFFNGEAETILFFSDEKVHLVGNALIKFDNISINSNLIIFNPKTGKITSDN